MPLDNSHQHSSADIMQSDNPHTPISPGSAVIGLQLFSATVHFNDAGITDYPGVDTGWVIPEGAWITDAWVVLKTAFDADTGLTLQTDRNGDGVMAGVPVGDSSLLEYTEGDLSQALDGEADGPLLDARSAFIKLALGGRVLAARVQASVGFFVQVSPGPLTVGEADVYAVVAILS